MVSGVHSARSLVSLLQKSGHESDLEHGTSGQLSRPDIFTNT
jgi:hypothetical protein